MKEYTILEQTAVLMNSADYKERFKAEYYQTLIRYGKLHDLNIKIDAANMSKTMRGKLPLEMPKHDCPDHLLQRQESVMKEYLDILETRAAIEGIEL